MLPSSTRISVLPDSPLRSQLMRFFKLVEKMHGSREKRCEQGEHWNWQQYKILWKGTFLYVSNESCYRGVICRRSSNATLFFFWDAPGRSSVEHRITYKLSFLTFAYSSNRLFCRYITNESVRSKKYITKKFPDWVFLIFLSRSFKLGEHWNRRQYKILWKGTFLYVSNESFFAFVWRLERVQHTPAQPQ